MIISAGHWRGNLGTCDWTLSSVTQADAEVAAPIFDLRKHAPGTEAEVLLEALLFESRADEASRSELFKQVLGEAERRERLGDGWRPLVGDWDTGKKS